MTGTPDAPAGPALQIERLAKRYGSKSVLHGVDLSVPAGSVLGLLGKNGAGKTTLLKCVLGLARPDAGAVRLLGEDARDLSDAAKARLGYVPQEIAGYSWMRAGELLHYTAAFYPRWNALLVRKLLTEWDVDPRDRVGRMSMGTRQKLAIILALAHEPDLLVLDEPAASLDPAARREFLKAVLDVAAGGRRTVVFSTHITSDLERVADRVAILRGGVIAYDGELDALKDSVKRLHVTAAEPLAREFNVPGAVRVRVEGNEAMVSVRDASPELIETLRRRHAASVRVEDLNLEEIFLEVQHAEPR
jgi:ABC-2 type transport system ATP-binding protein